MMKRVKGEYFTSCGSDDILCNDGLENLYNLTKKIPENKKNNFVYYNNFKYRTHIRSLL